MVRRLRARRPSTARWPPPGGRAEGVGLLDRGQASESAAWLTSGAAKRSSSSPGHGPHERPEARLESWRAVRAWLGWQQKLADRAISQLEGELASEAARRPPPAPPDWKLESIRTGSGPKALRVHVGDCAMSGGKPLGRKEARRMLAEGVEPCPYCNPENPLGMTG
ncbi:DUF6233 domain-containing protein [Streptomyces sp. NPDC058611]|uniref:DUF6233 domain-containing protein n=1 Tax=unclassified Streptomyces TaxID=2593676 RepID=UPI003647407B